MMPQSFSVIVAATLLSSVSLVQAQVLDPNVPRGDVTMTLTAKKVQKLPASDQVPFDVVLIDSPNITFSEPVNIGGKEVTSLPFFGYSYNYIDEICNQGHDYSGTGNYLCKSFGFGQALFSVNGLSQLERVGPERERYTFSIDYISGKLSTKRACLFIKQLVCKP